MTSWRHVMTSRHDDVTFCNMSVKCSNDLPVWWNPWFTFGSIFLCSLEPEIAFHVIMTSWRHVVTSSIYGNILYKVLYKLTCVVGPLNQSWYIAFLCWMTLDISLHVRMSSSWHHDMTAERHVLMVTSRQRLGVNRIDSCNFELCSQGQLCMTINSMVFEDGLGSYVK